MADCTLRAAIHYQWATRKWNGAFDYHLIQRDKLCTYFLGLTCNESACHDDNNERRHRKCWFRQLT